MAITTNLNELRLRWKSLVDCIYCDIEMDIGSVEETENGEQVVSFICPMCDTVAVFLKELEDDNDFIH